MLSTCTEYLNFELGDNRCELFKHGDVWYGNLKTKSEINAHNLCFKIDKDGLFVSELIGVTSGFPKYDLDRCQSLIHNAISIKNIYEKEYNLNLDISFSKFQIRNLNKDYHNIIDNLNLDIDIKDISDNVELAKIQSVFMDYFFFNKKNFKDVIDTLSSSSLVSDETKEYLSGFDVNNEMLEQSFACYISMSLSTSEQETNVFKNLNLKHFSEIFDFKEFSKSFEEILHKENRNNIENLVQNFKTKNVDNFVDYVTKTNISFDDDGGR